MPNFYLAYSSKDTRQFDKTLFPQCFAMLYFLVICIVQNPEFHFSPTIYILFLKDTLPRQNSLLRTKHSKSQKFKNETTTTTTDFDHTVHIIIGWKKRDIFLITLLLDSRQKYSPSVLLRWIFFWIVLCKIPNSILALQFILRYLDLIMPADICFFLQDTLPRQTKLYYDNSSDKTFKISKLQESSDERRTWDDRRISTTPFTLYYWISSI